MREGQLVAGRFEVERAVTSGGMGAIYRALDRTTGKVVALKVLHGLGATERFSREARVLAGLSHPGIVRYVSHGATSEGVPYLAMEWLDGEDLAGRLSRGPLPLPDAIRLAHRVAETLGFAHQAGVVHRDIKPANLFLEQGLIERTKIVDFGIARVEGATRTATGVALGTPGYMAPEQVSGGANIGPMADVFALGGVLFECVAGRPPFLAADVVALLAKILFEEVPRLREVAPDAPPWLDELVARMLAKDPAERPADGGAVAAALMAAAPLSTLPPRTPSTRLASDEAVVVSVVLAAGPAGEAAATVEQAAVEVAPVPGGAVRIEGRLALTPALRGAIRACGGEIEALPDGTVVVVVRPSAAATDRAAQAARCALVLRRELMDAPIVVATGRGASRAGGRPFGEAIDRAAALLRPGGMPEILLDEVTAGLLDARFDVEQARGALWLRAEREANEEVRTLLGKPTPCVGRERELAQLADLLGACADERRAAAALVTAGPGTGKSRLRHEFLRRTRQGGEPVEIWVARGDPLRAASPFALLAALVVSAAGVAEGAAVAERGAMLRARLARGLSGEALERGAAFLGEMIGVPLADGESAEVDAARRDAKLMGTQLRRAWESLVRCAAGASTLLVVVEDIHWADAPSVDFLEGTLRSVWDYPWVLLALGRPEAREAHPVLWQARSAHEIRLGELGRRASEALVRHALGDRIDAATTAHLAERAAGNAFYLEELVRAVAEQARSGGVSAAWAQAALPGTVLAMVEARLSRLPADARRLLRAASVLGERFWRGGVLALLGNEDSSLDVDGWLERLAVDEVITPAVEPRFPNEREYTFRHALLRDSAYATLLDDDRVLGHRRAGAWLERAGETEAAVVATHFEQGADNANAVAWYLRAARQALGRNDAQGVQKAFRRAEALGAAGEVLGELLVVRARAWTEVTRWREARLDFEAAMALIPVERAELRAEILTNLLFVYHWLADGQSFGAYTDEALSLATRLDREDLRRDTSVLLAYDLSSRGRWDDGVQLIRKVGHTTGRYSTLMAFSGHLLYFTGNYPEGTRLHQIALDATRQAADDLTRCVVLQNLALTLGATGRMAEAQQAVSESLALARENDLKPYLARALAIAGGLRFDLFDLEGADAQAAAAHEAGLAAGFKPAQMMTSVDRARYAALRGDVEASASSLDRAEALLREVNGIHAQTGRVRLAVARIEHLLARPDASRALAEADAALPLVAASRRTKYEAFARIARARALEALSRPEEAADELALALSLAVGMASPSLVLRAVVPLLALRPGEGLRVLGQKTASQLASSLDAEARTRFEQADLVRVALG